MSVNVVIDTNPVKIQSLPEISTLQGTDAIVVDRDGVYTGRSLISTLTDKIRSEASLSAYYADNVTIDKSSSNIFSVKNNSITLDKLSPDVRDLINNNYAPVPGDTTLTGSLSSFTTPLTATGQFLIININDQYKAVRIWDFY
jgi:hypothetical protein